MNKKIKVLLRGALGDRFGKVHYFSVSSVKTRGDIIRALSSLHVGFKEFLVKLGKQGYDYRVTDAKIQDGMLEDDIAQEVVSHLAIRPVLRLSGRVFRLIAGVALIAASFFVPVVGTLLLGVGASLIRSGLTRSYTPSVKPKRQEEEEQRRQNFNAQSLRAQYNAPIPFLFGNCRTEGMPILAIIPRAQRGQAGGFIFSTVVSATSRSLPRHLGGYRSTMNLAGIPHR